MAEDAMSASTRQDMHRVNPGDNLEDDGIRVVPDDDLSNEFVTANPVTRQMQNQSATSFAANETAKTFVGAFVEAAIEIDEDDQKLIQI